jgi:iron complex transport system substrate-binding protein
MSWKSSFYLLVGVVLLGACRPAQKQQLISEITDTLALSYARGFEITQSPNCKNLKIFTVGDNRDSYEVFKLVNRTDSLAAFTDKEVIPVPCKRIICLSSTQLTYFFALDDIENIVAINSSRHLVHKEMNKRIASGVVKRVGKEGHFNTELIASLNPDVIFISPFKRGGFDMLKSLGFPLVPMAAYKEETPLGRAEWVKMMAAFIGKEQKADTLFDKIAQRYNALKALTENVESRPTIFSGKLRSGSWYVPGGESFYAHYFHDAGAEYVVKDNKQGAYPLDFESMYMKAAKADVWRLLLTEPEAYDREAMLADDPRYGDFQAFKKGNIMACKIRVKPYYEQNAMKPDVILADYIHFLHPELLPDYQPEFYEKLK